MSWGSGVERLWCTEELWVALQWGWVMSMPSREAKGTGSPGTDEAASYPGQIHSVSSFGYRYCAVLALSIQIKNLKLACALWCLSLYPPKEYWYSLGGSFLCWCEINTEISVESSDSCVSYKLSSHSPTKIRCFFLQLHSWLKIRCWHSSAVVSCHLSIGWCAFKDLFQVQEEVYEIPVGVKAPRVRLALCVGGSLWGEGWAGPFQPW